MSNRDPSPAISRQAGAAKSQGISKTATTPALPRLAEKPDVRRSDLLRTFRAVAVLLACVAAVVGLVLAANVIIWACHGFPYDPGGGPGGMTSADLGSSDWSRVPMMDNERFCAKFIRLKNAGDPAAVNLLGSAPAVPAAPVSRAEADHLQADFFLQQDIRIVGVGRDRRTQALVLYTKGNVFAPTLQVRTTDGVETAQRTMSNPDLTVEVRDGRIYGVAANLHVEP